MTSAFRFLLIVLAGSACAGEPPKEAGTPKTPEQVLAMAASLTGLEPLPAPTLAPLQAEDTPSIFPKGFTGKKAFTVKFRSEPLTLTRDHPEFKDKYPRNFAGLFLADTGQLVGIKSRFAEKDPLMPPELSRKGAEKILDELGVTRVGIPTAPPKVSFLDALGCMMNRGMGHPYRAREISGVYVVASLRGNEPRALWLIILRGYPGFEISVPPLPPNSPPQPPPRDPSTPEPYDQSCSIIDATSGEVLGGISGFRGEG